jgi:hypothetical protein
VLRRELLRVGRKTIPGHVSGEWGMGEERNLPP